MNGSLAAAGLVLAGGVFLAMQAPTNAMLARGVGSPTNAALVSFVIGSAALLAFALVTRGKPDMSVLRTLPWYVWIGGVYGAVLVAGMAFAAPKIGVGPTVTIAIAGQVAMALVIDQFGWFGVARHAVSGLRLGGAVLVVLGVLMVRKG